MTLLEPYNLPFAVALAALAFIALAQILGAGDLFEGGDADFDFDIDADVDGADALAPVGAMDGLLSLIGLGRVPFLIWLATLLLIFATIGVAGQALLTAVIGAPLPAFLAGLGAGALALPANGQAVRPIGALLPKDETSAVSLNSLIRRDAEIQTGTARHGSPARSKVLDRFGHPHFVMVEPHNPEEVLTEGETVLLVRREGETFYAMRYQNPLLSP